jgi:site-specific recombinase XerD
MTGTKTRAKRKAQAPAKPATWDEAVTRFAAFLAEQEKSEHTVRNYSDDLRAFARWYQAANSGEPVLDTVSSLDARGWKGYLLNGDTTLAAALTQAKRDPRSKVKHAPQTVNRKLAALKSFLVWMQTQDWIDTAAVVPKSVRQEPPKPRWLTRQQRLAFLREVDRHASRRDKALIATFYHVGTRISEAAAVSIESLEMSERKGSIEIIGKGRKHRTVPLNVEVRAALRDLIEHAGITEGPVFRGQRGPLTANAIWRIVAEYGRRAGLDLTPHELRHTFCRTLVERGVRLEVVASLAGHESLETTRRYVEPGEEDREAAVDTLAAME